MDSRLKKKLSSQPDPVLEFGLPAVLIVIVIIGIIEVSPYVARFIVGNLGM